MKIMLADDDVHVLNGLQKLLSITSVQGEIIATACNGAEALKKAETDCPDVIISDIKMPVMDGLRLAQIVNENYPAIRMILLSSFGDFEYARQAIRYGVSDYILKPITMEKIKKIEQALEKIYRSKQQADKNLKFIFNKENIVKVLFEALKQNNRNAVEDFFLSEDCTKLMAQGTADTAGLYFITMLYSFLEECGIADCNMLGSEKDETQNRFLMLNKTDDRRHFLIDLYCRTADTLQYSNRHSARNIIAEVNRLIKKEYRAAHFNISYIADTLHISVPYLSMVFLQKTGEHLSEHITALRLNYAKQLLQDTAVPVFEVALQSGYQDSKYFARVFRKNENMSPTEYRSLHTEHI